ncbi:hypothetical protein AGMMS4957_09560 [Bacteroidia bacterium]|nr:hypothetical protein AGMMS4957_09560 [Bacteroidia bacterium]
MDKILSYNKKSNGEDWFDLTHGYGEDEISEIKDPNAGQSRSPKTAIPSPFAQMDLVKNAFLKLSHNHLLKGIVLDEMLVSNALDIAQLFFDYENYADRIKIITWNRRENIEELQNSSQHRLLGETLEMYLRQDASAYNFDKLDNLFFLSYKNEIIGGTSPASLFMAAPNTNKDFPDIKIGDDALFSKWLPLYKRDKDFVYYIYYLFAAYPTLNCIKEVREYLIQNFKLLDKHNSELYRKITDEIGNPETATSDANVRRLQEAIENKYDKFEEEGVSVFVPLYKRKKADLKQTIQKSDFLILPTYKPKKKGSEDMKDLPLILPNNDLNPIASDPYMYVENRPWRDSDEIKESIKLGSDNVLPNTSYSYPWHSAKHFFTTSLIQFVFPIDDNYFFDGNLNKSDEKNEKNGVLLPITTKFFEYFSADDLRGAIGGKPRFEIEQKKDEVKAILRIPVEKGNGSGFITLSRIYKKHNNNSYDYTNDEGALIEIPFSLSIFPFIRLKNKDNQYRVQAMKQNMGDFSNHDIKLDFRKNTGIEAKADDKGRTQESEGGVNTNYYDVPTDFDYVRICLNGKDSTHEGVVIPLWKEFKTGDETSFTFAVDFGTTNTHVEVMKGKKSPEALKFTKSDGETLVATLYNQQWSARPIFKATLKQEFLPIELGKEYGFPQRTIISEKIGLTETTLLFPLRNVNIPFIYEKEDTGLNNKITPNLKWAKESENHAKAYIEELMLLMRAKVLLDGGNLDATTVIWSYPLSMQKGKVDNLHTIWEDVYKKYVNEDVSKIVYMPESIAPHYYYSNNKMELTGSTLVSVDIGGGTSDIVVINDSKPVLMTSFRFAANVLFGDAFEDAQAENNPMVQQYCGEFAKLLKSDGRYAELSKILEKIKGDKHSEDINAFLFSLVNSPIINGDENFSYNKKLKSDNERKIIFIYFYATIIYYISKLLIDRGIEKPKSIMFSGTGSKVLDIVGSQKQLDKFSRELIEKIFGSKYDSDFQIVMEREKPKQITCKGALLHIKGEGQQAIEKINDDIHDVDNSLKTNFYMIAGTKTLNYKNLKEEAILEKLVKAVEEFNAIFIEFCEDRKIVDAFAIDAGSYKIFKEEVGKNLKNYLVAGCRFMNKNLEEDDSKDVEDAPVFYPIIGAIRKNLICNLGKIKK